jgi:hypothetical protein
VGERRREKILKKKKPKNRTVLPLRVWLNFKTDCLDKLSRPESVSEEEKGKKAGL